MSIPNILVCDDDVSICTVLEHAIRKRGMKALCTHEGDVLLDWVRQGRGDAVITDVMLPIGGKPGSMLEHLPEIKRLRPQLPIIVISARNTLMTAVTANQRGAFEYIPKPFDLSALMESVDKSLGSSSRPQAAPEGNELNVGQESIENAGLIGRSPAMQEIYRTLARLVGLDLTVMITGESGTGKELVARALHSLGLRKDKPFVAVNMAAIPRELVESELFGHEKGAFTGAVARKQGKFEQAEGGTLFLDEIGDMPLDAQSKLLRVLQQGEFIPVGGTRSIPSNVRIICATHHDLLQRVKSGDFREDLYYRLNVIPVRIPPLRDRMDDIFALASHFLRKAEERGMAAKILQAEAVEELKTYSWPGNVRELENLMYRLSALCPESMIGCEAVAEELRHLKAPEGANEKRSFSRSLEEEVRRHLKHYFTAHSGELPPPGLYDRVLPLVEKPMIEMALASTHGNQVKTAWLLGINRNTLRKKITELAIDLTPANLSAKRDS